MKKNQTQWVVIGGIVLVFLYAMSKGKSSSQSQGVSIANATNSPIYPVTSNGSQVAQLIPKNQVTPNEPGTAPIFNQSGGYQYG